MVSIGFASNFYTLSALQRPASPAQRTGRADTELTVATIPDAINAQLDAYQQRWVDASRAIAQLHSSPQESAQQKKAAAAEKVQRLKEQLQLLMRMAAVGNPKANIREIAQLARELASAAQEYAAAGGGGVVQAAAPTSNTPDASGMPNDASLHAAADALSPAAASSTETESSRQNLQNTISVFQQKSASAEADQKFLIEIRNLATQLKALAKQQEKRIHQSGDQAAQADLATVNRAMTEVEKSASCIASSGMDVTPSIHVLA